MNKTAIKNFAISARKKLIAMAIDKAGIIGITKEAVAEPTSRGGDFAVFPTHFGTETRLDGTQLRQRENLVHQITEKGYDSVMEEVAYTWFNRLIAVRFMEVNDYLPTRVRVLSSETVGKAEPDLVTLAPDVELGFTPTEVEEIYALKDDPRKSGELFKKLFIKQCNALGEILPELFEHTADYTELLLDIAWDKEDGVVRELLTVDEADFREAVEIIGWMYQYYNTEPKQTVFDGLKNNVKITKENIPAATQLFTPDWIVRYMVENSLGRLWLEGHPNDTLKTGWKYYLDEAEQEAEVQAQLDELRKEYKTLTPEEIKVIDPCMGSGHILVYAFDVLMQIYVSCGYAERDAASLILEKNLYGLDIDKRAYQLSYFALMMKARGYDRRLFGRGVAPQVYYPNGNQELEEFGSLLKADKPVPKPEFSKLISLFEPSYEEKMNVWNYQRLLSEKYDVVVTNPPYMGSSGMNEKLADFVKKNYPDAKTDLFSCFIERGNKMTRKNGYNTMVTMQSWMFLSSFEKMRENIIASKTITNLMHMENMVMGIAFGTAVTNFRNYAIKGFKGTYNHITMKDIGDNGLPIEFPVAHNRFVQVGTENFSKIPGSPIAYWVSEQTINDFLIGNRLGDISKPRQGMATTNNNRFLRLWHEVAKDNIGFCLSSIEDTVCHKKWFPYNKGGDFRKWYGNNDYIVNFRNKGEEVCAYIDATSAVNSKGRVINREHYFHECISWSLISSGSIAFRYKPNGFIFDVAGMSCFTSHEMLMYLLGLNNSLVVCTLMATLAPTINFQAGDIANIPVIIDDDLKETVVSLVEENISNARNDWDAFETSWDFKKHPLI